MKSLIKIAVIAAAAVLLAGMAFFAWSNYFGTALDSRLQKADAAVNAVKIAAKQIDALKTDTEKFPDAWSGLQFDEATETTRIIEDLGSNRGYKVEALRDPSAARVQKDILGAEAGLKKAIKEASTASKTLSSIEGFVPADKRKAYEKANITAKAAVKKGERVASNLRELRFDVDIWGFLSISLKINGLLMESFEKVSADLSAGDYTATAAGAQDALSGVNESVTWLTHGKQELTNITAYAKDTDGILSFISEAKGVAEAFNNAAAAGIRGDIAQANSEREIAKQKLLKLKESPLEPGYVADFRLWFMMQAQYRLSGSHAWGS